MKTNGTFKTQTKVGTTYKKVVEVFWTCDEESNLYSKIYMNYFGEEVMKFYDSSKALKRAYNNALKQGHQIID